MKFKVMMVAVCLLSLAAVAQNTVRADQGKPGNQGPWPVLLTNTNFYDGGIPIAVAPVQCNGATPDGGTPDRVTAVGVASTQVPATAVSSIARYWLLVCNSSENSGTPQVKCLTNNTAPVMGITNPGQVMGVGDCYQYNINGANQLRCISDTAATAVTSYECDP